MNTCYTVITNNYDELKPCPESKGWEYVVFSDKFLDVPPWDCVITDKHNRELKLMPNHELNSNLTLYVDGSIQIIGDLNDLIKEVPNIFTAWKHPHRDTLKQEAVAVIKIKGCNESLVLQQVNKYISAGYDGPLAACGILLRDLSNPTVRRINKLWYSEWLNSCGRDQLSFGYSCWKHGLDPYLFEDDIFKKHFKWGRHL